MDWSRIQQGFGCCDPNPVVPVGMSENESHSNSSAMQQNTAYVKTSRSPSVGVGIVFREDRENGGGTLRIVLCDAGTDTAHSTMGLYEPASRYAMPGTKADYDSTSGGGLCVVAVQPGLKLMAIDDKEVSACNAPDIAPYILGPPGSTVKLTFRDPESDDVFSVMMLRGWAGGNTAAA